MVRWQGVAWHEAEKRRNHPDVEAYLADLDERQRALCNAVRDHVKQDSDVLEFIAWGIPCYWADGPLCYTSAAKTHVTVGIFRGIEIQDASGLLVGTGKSPIRKATVKLNQELPGAFADWIAQAKSLPPED